MTLKTSKLIQFDPNLVDFLSVIYPLTKYEYITYNFVLLLNVEAYFSNRVLVRLLIDICI